MIEIEIVAAWSDRAEIRRIRVPAGSTVGAALEQAGLVVVEGQFGVFGRRVGRDAVLAAGDRIELYRPLAADPKDARRRRA